MDMPDEIVFPTTFTELGNPGFNPRVAYDINSDEETEVMDNSLRKFKKMLKLRRKIQRIKDKIWVLKMESAARRQLKRQRELRKQLAAGRMFPGRGIARRLGGPSFAPEAPAEPKVKVEK